MVIEREIKSEYLRVNAPTEIQTVNRLYYTDSPIDYTGLYKCTLAFFHILRYVCTTALVVLYISSNTVLIQ